MKSGSMILSNMPLQDGGFTGDIELETTDYDESLRMVL